MVTSILSKALKPIYLLSKVLGLITYSNNHGKPIKPSTIANLYSIFHFILILVLVVTSLVYRHLYLYVGNNVDECGIFLDYLSTIMYSTLVLSSLYLGYKKQPSLIQLFYIKIKKANAQITFPITIFKEIHHSLKIKCFLVIILCLPLSVLDCWLYQSISLVDVSSIFIDYWLIFYIFVVAIQVDGVISVVNELLTYLNTTLKDYQKQVQEMLIKFQPNLEIELLHKIQRVSFAYYNLCDSIDLINSMFGIQLMLFVICTIIWVLYLLCFAVALSVQDRLYAFSINIYSEVLIQILWACGFVVSISKH